MKQFKIKSYHRLTISCFILHWLRLNGLKSKLKDLRYFYNKHSSWKFFGCWVVRLLLMLPVAIQWYVCILVLPVLVSNRTGELTLLLSVYSGICSSFRVQQTCITEKWVDVYYLFQLKICKNQSADNIVLWRFMFPIIL